MGEDEDKQSREDRTIFIPGGSQLSGVGGQQPQMPPAAPPTEPPTPATLPPGVTSAVPRPATGWGSATPFAPDLSEGRRIQIGDVLNHIFEVRRFIGRGGMGEVFEGVNVNTEERVAIKVMLPHLAAEPAVQAMFRKEARTLTRLSHPGLVQYRVLAQEPHLRVLYIVTDYIDGTNLSDCLSTLEATPQELVQLLRKLAEGLAAAHALGAIHRDISPDNIMLENGLINRAKIIDFGIAKDLDAAGSTIVGDGFAGKLNYVAPEQLGDFDRAIGPWTDVYSLGLTMMAVILGRDVNMGATLVDAVDKRRAGLDVSQVPEEMRAVLDRMLKANPAERLRSMDEVLQMLAPHHGGTQFGPASGMTQLGTLSPGGAGGGQKPGIAPRTLAFLGGGAVLAIAAAVAFVVLPGDKDAGQPAGGGTVTEAADIGPVEPPADPLGTARRVVEAEVKDAPCSWLDVVDLAAEGTRISLTLRGVSGEGATAMRQIQDALKRSGLQAPSIEMSDVSPISPNMCGPVEAFTQIRATGAGRLSVAQRKFEMNVLSEKAGPDAGKLGAEAVFTLNLAGFNEDMTLVGLEETGEMEQLADSKAAIMPNLQKLPNEVYRLGFFTTHTGWSGILMLTGRPPFDANLTNESKSRGDKWADNFLKLARERGWKSEMVWYRTVDEQANSR